MSDKPKILLLSTAYLPHIGGSELAIKNITDRVGDFEFHMITARLDKADSVKEKIGNVTVYRVGGAWGTLKFLLPKNFLPVAIFLKAVELMKDNEYKLVHAYQASEAAGGGWLIKNFYPDVPFMVTIQEGKDLKGQGSLMNFFRDLIIYKANAATAISRYLRDYLKEVKSDLPVEIVPNGVDINKFSQKYEDNELSELRNKFGINSEDKVIISASRLVPKNGIDVLIEAMGILNSGSKIQDLRFKLILIGDGMQRKYLELRVKKLGIENDVIFTGTVNYDELPKFLKIGHVFSRPSRTEGLGSAFLEAMAAELPVVATDVGGIKDFLTDGETGLVCEQEDPQNLADKIKKLFDDTELRNKVVANASAMVREKYSWDKIAEQFKAIYSKYER